MKLNDVMLIFNRLAPLKLAETWDNVGLLCGDPQQKIRSVLLTIDLTRSVLDEAISNKSDLIMAYHPTIWEGLKKIIPGKGPSSLIYELVRNNIAVYSMHSSLDLVSGGINDALAEIIGITHPEPLEKRQPVSGTQYKLVCFLPESDLKPVSEAIYRAGGGKITPDSNYSKCAFRVLGEGSFACGEVSNPTIGQPGSYEEVREYRFETVVPAANLGAALNAMRSAHSYEEPAFDVIPMIIDQDNIGLGRYGRLIKPIRLKTIINMIKDKLKIDYAGLIGPRDRLVKIAAVAAGSCGSAYLQAIKNNCDLYLTGEIKHHHAIDIQESGMSAIVVNHSNSERFYLRKLVGRMRSLMPTLDITVSRKDRDPIFWL